MTDESITPKVGDVVIEESSRQAVILVFSLIGTVVMLYLYTKLGEPDSFRKLKVTTALNLKRYAQKRVDWWQRIADKAATIYNSERY